MGSSLQHVSHMVSAARQIDYFLIADIASKSMPVVKQMLIYTPLY